MKHLYLLFFITFLFTACKKKEKTPEENSPSTTTTSGATTSAVPIATIATSFNGFLKVSMITSKTNNSAPVTNIYCSADFYASAIPSTQTLARSYTLKINSVLRNNDTLPRGVLDTSYYKNISTLNPNNWKINGDVGIPSFSYDAGDHPQCDELASFPDTISLSAGPTIHLNIKNINQGELLMLGPKHVSFILINGNNEIKITDSLLTSLGVSPHATINTRVLLNNSNAVNVSGKNFQFLRSTTWIKNVYIRP